MGWGHWQELRRWTWTDATARYMHTLWITALMDGDEARSWIVHRHSGPPGTTGAPKTTTHTSQTSAHEAAAAYREQFGGPVR
jgi:hypothetical protein